eukprot:11178467-Lingulodinium_polyedra.AAC.1
MEYFVVVPNLVELLMMVFIPKASGGLRPIGIFCSWLRVWMRTRRQLIRAWEAANSPSFLWGGVGRPADVAMWTMTFMAEAGQNLGVPGAAAMLDIWKCYEMVQHDVLSKMVKRFSYPTRLAALAIRAYRGLRFI